MYSLFCTVHLLIELEPRLGSFPVVAAALPDLGVLQLHLNLCGVLASPCINVNLHPKGFICIDLLFGLACTAANPVIDQSTRIDQNFSFEGSAWKLHLVWLILSWNQ